MGSNPHGWGVIQATGQRGWLSPTESTCGLLELRCQRPARAFRYESPSERIERLCTLGCGLWWQP